MKKQKQKCYEVCGKYGKRGKYRGAPYLRTYNKELALKYAEKHSDSCEIIVFDDTRCCILMYGGDKGC